MLDFFKIIFLVNATIAVGFEIFIQAVKLCIAMNVSPFWGAGVCVYFCLYMLFLRYECRAAEEDL